MESNNNYHRKKNKKKEQQINFKVTKGTFIQYKKGLIEKDYEIGELLGSGSFATVRKVKHIKTNQIRALKIIKKHQQQEVARMYLEVEILKKLVHPNIMQIFEFYEDSSNFYIITELCEGGELFDKIVEKGSFSEYEACEIIRQILSAVNYIHSNNVVHRDLKPENILLDTKKDNVIKIIDWGNARFFDKNKKMNRISGTPYYIAPEVLAGQYDEKCDIWSCGVILYILLCGYPPFNGANNDMIFEKIKVGKFQFPVEEWYTVSQEVKDLIANMLEINPIKRYSASQCLEHEWFNSKDNKKKANRKLSIKCLNNMKKFHADIKLGQAALTFIVNNLLSKNEKNDLIEIFRQFDTNGDGVLTKEEIKNGYKQYMPYDDAEEAVENLFKEIDIDKSGSIDYNEFILSAINKKKILNKEKLEATFKMFDEDGSGTISRDEIKNVFGKHLNNKTLENIINEVDANGDGEISLKEFKEMMLKCIEDK